MSCGLDVEPEVVFRDGQKQKENMKIRKLQLAIMAASLAGAMSASAALTWNFTTASDYWVNNAVVTALPGGGSAYVAPRYLGSPPDPDDVLWGTDYAAVFAMVNTQALLRVGDITGGGFTLSGMNHPGAVYGSLYLSPSGAGGSTVMINMSPMGRTGADGSYIYTFGLDTPADVKIKNGVDGSWGTAQTTGTFGGAIDWVEASAYSGTYAAFFGPQIGMSNTSETTFTVSEIQLQVVPEPTTMIAGALLLLPFGASTLRMLRKNRKA
jgi:hypothetical protein